jgi:hypothetical protein
MYAYKIINKKSFIEKNGKKNEKSIKLLNFFLLFGSIVFKADLRILIEGNYLIIYTKLWSIRC